MAQGKKVRYNKSKGKLDSMDATTGASSPSDAQKRRNAASTATLQSRSDTRKLRAMQGRGYANMAANTARRMAKSGAASSALKGVIRAGRKYKGK